MAGKIRSIMAGKPWQQLVWSKVQTRKQREGNTRDQLASYFFPFLFVLGYHCLEGATGIQGGSSVKLLNHPHVIRHIMLTMKISHHSNQSPAMVHSFYSFRNYGWKRNSGSLIFGNFLPFGICQLQVAVTSGGAL